MSDEFYTLAEKKAVEAENLAAFQGIKLLYIRTQVEKMLALIGKGGFFDEYTRHDMSHIDGMLKITEWIIPDSTKEHMSKADWLMLVLAIYLHDMGMLVSIQEFENRDKDHTYLEYRDQALSGELGIEYKNHILELGDGQERFLYQEYVRSQHAARIKRWISGKYYEDPPEACKGIVNALDDVLGHLDAKFRRDLGLICESHHLNDLEDFEKYSPRARYGNSSDECVNLQYVAIILRTADILHITCERAPSVQFLVINPSNVKSIIEWQKQIAVKAVSAKIPRNQEGAVDAKLPTDTIEITAYFDQPDQAEAFFGLSAYIMYMRDEIKKNFEWVQAAAKKEGVGDYKYPWCKVDDENVETQGFEPRKLQFTVDQASILKMLVGHTLYNDSSVVIRELIQNGIDAVKLQYCIQTGQEDVPDYVAPGEVRVSWREDRKTLTVSDNGTGMTIQEVEDFLLRVGASKYRSEQFQKKFPRFPAISRFGIGILTCFLIADDIDISTSSTEEPTANVISLRKVNGKYLLKKSPKNEVNPFIKQHGTQITLHVRPDVDIQNILSAVQKWILFPQCKVTLCTADGKETPIGYRSPKDALTDYLNASQFVVDNQTYKVEEVCQEGVTMAYALKYDRYLNEWGFLSSRLFKSDIPSPVGLCIEGIRVEFSTPGFDGEKIIAVANTHNCQPVLTNVARSAIEDNDSKEAFLRILYSCYAKHIETQMAALAANRSLDLAADECRYLMRPLLEAGPNHPTERQSKRAFFQAFDELKSIVIEERNTRRAASVTEVTKLEQVYVVDSVMVSAAETLLREVKTDSTLSGLIRMMEPDITLSTDIPMICGYNAQNVLHRRALHGKQVSSICVFKEHRRVDIQFSSGANNWTLFEAASTRIHVPIEPLDIQGLTDEFGVYTVDGIYLSHKNTLTQYLRELLKRFDYEHSSKDKLLASVLLHIACNDRLLRLKPTSTSEYNREDLFRRVTQGLTPYSSALWERIDRNDFITTLFKDRYVLYRPRDWSRQSNEPETPEFLDNLPAYGGL